ncbi:hypothetical protein ISN45_Aa08g028220 [Arabidopsis thaliana x Arabidopsis arenosa]|uniref:NYN domain-containing protein n=1 Tax=Arabidopsis thaliana x Arabidopsis arenosa TaxID=1240361 RepID=A0A8T1XS62_9BRAS|nr:hypothetical protein ISN45_Aa08g028220 [Arabidopsis thaliana x Arabidopsis arenosa]
MDSSTFDRGWVMVMWDVEDLSILNRLDPELVEKNIMSDLDDQGFDSGLSKIWAVVDDNIPKTLTDIYRSAGISMTLVPQGNKHARVHKMSVSSLTWAVREQNNRSTLIILSENMKEDKQLTSVVEAIKKKDIFWDLKDSSILYEHDPVLIYRSIKSALWEKGYQGHWQILAFFVGDGNALSKDLIDKYMVNLIRPIPLPKGNECAIVQVMILRILGWALRTCGRPSNLIILSSNIKEENQVASVVQTLREKGNYNIVFQDPARLLHQCLVNPFHQSGREPTENATL